MSVSDHVESVFLVDFGDRYPNRELMRHLVSTPCDHSDALALFATLAAVFEQALVVQAYGNRQWNESQEHTLAVCIRRLEMMRAVVDEVRQRIAGGAVGISLIGGVTMLDRAIELIRETPRLGGA